MADYELNWADETAFFRLTRPAQRNAITRSILDGIEEVCEGLDAGRARAVIFTGEGEKAFSSGTDLAESAELGAEGSLAKTRRARGLFMRLHRSHWTSVAALNGLAYGGGLELAMGCTFRVAAPGVRLGLPEIKLGVLPCYGGTQLLPTIVGRARALDLLLTGRPVEPEEALRIGLIDRVAADPETLLDDTRAFLGEILGKSQFAIDRIRRSVDAAMSDPTDAGLAIEEEAFLETSRSEDAMEGVTAFFEKRAPKWKHK